MIQHDVDAGLVEHRVEPGLLKLIDGHRGGDIVAQHHIQSGVDQLPCLDGFPAAVGGQDFLRHCHAHGVFLPDKRYLLLMALTSALMPATMISVSVPQPQVISPLAHFKPT